MDIDTWPTGHMSVFMHDPSSDRAFIDMVICGLFFNGKFVNSGNLGKGALGIGGRTFG
jgi:hypothetical protein